MKPKGWGGGGISVSRRETNPRHARGEKRQALAASSSFRKRIWIFHGTPCPLSVFLRVEDALINAFNEPSSIEYIRGMVLVFREIQIDGRIKFLYLNKYYLYSYRLELLSISISIMRVF